MVPTMTTMASANAAETSLDSKSCTTGIYTNTCKCLKQEGLSVVARDGIEPPTPAFSGLRSTD